MAQIHAEFQERITRAVSRFMRHAEGSGLPAGVLDGKVALTIVDGVVTQIVFPPATPKGKPVVLETLHLETTPEYPVEDAAAGSDATPAD